jgi:hypothetical protein
MDFFLNNIADQTYQAYVEMLLAEPSVKTNPIIIIKDFVSFAIKSGKYTNSKFYLINFL